MSLCNMKELLHNAEKKGIAIGAFNVANIDMIRGTIRAAETLNSPVILQFTEGWRRHIPLELIGPVMVAAAKEAKVDTVVHIDHGRTEDVLKQALEMGFTSIMFDGSSYPIEENIEIVNKLAAVADEYDASLEAELGVLGGAEDDYDTCEAMYTNPDDVKFFCESTNIDALAISIGNAHGHYTVEPRLNYDILKRCAEAASVPLVLHGGTGISPDDIQKSISMGMAKINISTSNFDAVIKSIKGAEPELGKDGYFALSSAIENSVFQNVTNHIRIFNMCGGY